MDVTRFGLGVRFDALGTMPDDGVAKQFFEEVFSVLTVTDVKGLHVSAVFAMNAGVRVKTYTPLYSWGARLKICGISLISLTTTRELICTLTPLCLI